MDADGSNGRPAEARLRDCVLKAADAMGVPHDAAEADADEWLRLGRATSETQPATESNAAVEPDSVPPTPLRDLFPPPRFPVECLARWQREWVEGEACATQTPVDLAGMLSFAVISTCSARRFRVRVNSTWVEPTNVYVCVALPPASRKSAVFRDAIEPLQEFERLAAEPIMEEIAAATALLRAAERRQQNLECAIARAKQGERHALEIELQLASKQTLAAKAAIPRPPQLTCGDTTQEELVRLLAANGGTMALLDAEGCGPIQTMLGRYSPNQTPQVEVFLKAHVGDMIRVDRVGREGSVVHNPRLTMALTIQPVVLDAFRNNAQVRGIGLLGRFWLCVPRSNIGARTIDPPAMTDAVRRDYGRAVRDMLAAGRAAADSTLSLSADARALLRQFEQDLEPRLGPGGDLAHLTEWAGKLAGSVVRTAGLLHIADELGDQRSAEISVTTMSRAVQFGEYLLGHAQRALVQVSVDPHVADAEHILAWIQKARCNEFSERDVFNAQRGRFATMEHLRQPLTLLEKHRWISRQPRTGGGGRGRPASPSFRVHPETHNPQNAHK